MAKKSRSSNKPIMVPEAGGRMYEMRYEIAKKLGYTNLELHENWWDVLTPIQQSEINGVVTKLMIEKAKIDMMKGMFPYK